MVEEKENGLVLVTRKACFGLPTACPSCLPVYIYLKFANVSFDIHFDLTNPDAGYIPYIEHGDYVVFNHEKGGVIEGLKEDGIVDLDSKLPTHSIPEWLAMKAMINSWLADAVLYELWIGSDGSAADKIYFSDLPWPIGKVLHWKQTQAVKQLLGITKGNAEAREVEIYRKATMAYEALSTRLGEQNFFLENRSTSLDAVFFGHAMFVLQTSSDTSVLRCELMKHDNLVRYTEKLKVEYLEGSSSSSSVPRSPFDTSTSSTPRRRASSNWGSKPKNKAKREKTEEEKTFRRRGKYFLATQLVAVLVFLSLLGGSDEADVDIEDDDAVDDDGLNYGD